MAYLDLSVDHGTVRASLDLPVLDLTQPLRLDLDRDGVVSAQEIDAQSASLLEWFGAALALSADGRDCAPGDGSVESRNGLLSLHLDYQCHASYSRLTLRSAIGQTVGAGSSTFVELHRKGVSSSRTLLTGADASYTFSFSEVVPWWQTAGEFVGLGIEHIARGYDHILFLLALLMMCTSLRSIVGLATAFTVAHTITLSLAATRTLELPSRLTESAIAASIAWVAVENWLYSRPVPAGEREPLGLRLRWLLTFSFGLIHGFGFASALAERGLPSTSVPLALGCFNLGVELGQIVLIAAFYPVLQSVRRRAWYRPTGIRVTALGIFALAIYWFAVRAFALPEWGG